MKLPAKRYINYFIVFLLLAAFLDIAISSYVLWAVLPRGLGLHGLGHECSLWGTGPIGNTVTVFEWPRYIWVEFHAWIGVAVAGLILIHLLLNWSFIVETTKRVKSYINKGLRAIVERYTTALILFVLFLFQVFSGCVVWLILPRGELDYYNMIAGVGRTFWGLQRNVWSDLHAWTAIILAATIIVHVIIHWRWIFNITLGREKQKRQGEEQG